MSKFVVVVHWLNPKKTIAQYLPDVTSFTLYKVLELPHREFFVVDDRTKAEALGEKIEAAVPSQSYTALDEDENAMGSVREPAIYILPFAEVFRN